MMDVCVDLSHLRQITGQDHDLEAELFAEFIDASGDLLLALERCQDADNDEVWGKSAHALKGISVNLGAKKLGVLAQDAQENVLADAVHKAAMLKDMRNEHAKVVAFLRAQSA